MPKSALYEQDFYAWANEQAALLRSGRLAAADLDHIAEEIESMGRAEKRALVSHLAVLLQHLLKWQAQPERRGSSWRLSIANSRDDVADLLRDNPSLKAQVDEAFASAYRRARRQAAAEMGIAETALPTACPFEASDALDEGFWPQGQP